MPNRLRTFATLLLLWFTVCPLRPAGSAPASVEDAPLALQLDPITGASRAVLDAEAHRVADELLRTALAETRKFVFVSPGGKASADLVVSGSLDRDASGRYVLNLKARRTDGSVEVIDAAPDGALEAVVQLAASRIAGLQKRTGYVIKREGSRIVIARGSDDGVAVGQRYKTTDTFESFVIRAVSTNTAEGEIVDEPAGAPARAPAAGSSPKALGTVDIVFVIDTTGSMQEEIDGVLANCERFASQLAAQKLDVRLGLLVFGEHLRTDFGFATGTRQFKEWLKPLYAKGGGDEIPFTALERTTEYAFRAGAKPVFVLITDEPAYDAIADAWAQSGQAASGCSPPPPATLAIVRTGVARRVHERLAALGATVFPVTVDDAQGLYRGLATATGGTFYDLEKSQDFTALLGRLGERISGMFVEQ